MRRCLILIPLLCSLAWGQGVTILPKTTTLPNTTVLPGTVASTPPSGRQWGENGNSGASSIPVSLSSNSPINDVIACYVFWIDPSITLTSVTDSKSNSYTVLTGDNQTSGNFHTAQALAQVTSAGTLTITGNFSGTVASSVKIGCADIENAATSSIIDQHVANTQSSPGTGTNAVTTGNITTAVSGDYLFVWNVDCNGNVATISAGTGYTIRNGGTNNQAIEDQVQASAGIIAGTFTYSSGGADTAMTGIIAIKP
jgi:hypothetical protein